MNDVGTTSRDAACGRITRTAMERITGIGEEVASVTVATECVARHKAQCVAGSFPLRAASPL
jgi:hypothetical protein